MCWMVNDKNDIMKCFAHCKQVHRNKKVYSYIRKPSLSYGNNIVEILKLCIDELTDCYILK